MEEEIIYRLFKTLFFKIAKEKGYECKAEDDDTELTLTITNNDDVIDHYSRINRKYLIEQLRKKGLTEFANMLLRQIERLKF